MGNGQLSLLLDSSIGTWKGQQFTLFVKRFFFFNHYAIKDIIRENLEIMGEKRSEYLVSEITITRVEHFLPIFFYIHKVKKN